MHHRWTGRSSPLLLPVSRTRSGTGSQYDQRNGVGGGVFIPFDSTTEGSFLARLTLFQSSLYLPGVLGRGLDFRGGVGEKGLRWFEDK